MIDWIRQTLLTEGMISKGDLDLLVVTDSIEETVAIMHDCYVNQCWQVRSDGGGPFTREIK
jgi:predicted Rossmann-fold nucleotide-binding protein